jgi:hypothetical protein
MPNPSDTEIRELAYRNADILQGYLDDTEGWHTSKNTKEVLIEYKRSVCPGFENGYLYRGQTEYNCPKEMVFKYIDPTEGDGSLRVKWDKDIKSCKVLKRIDEDITIQTSMTNSAAKGLIAPRDFIDVILVKKTENYVSSNGVSIEIDEFPPIEKFVRGFNYPCGLICLPIPDKPNSTKVVSLIQPDIKGMLPRSLVDAAIPKSMVGFFSNLREILKKDGHISS